MPLTERSKQSMRAWDRENMHTISCRVRANEADIFKEYCAAHGTTPGSLIKEYVYKCIVEYGKELEEAEKDKDQS